MKSLMKNSFIWIVATICIIGILLRFAFLNKIPSGISDDELDYIVTAQSVHYSGKTLEGTFSPFSFQPVPADAKLPYARAPYMLLTPFIGLTPHGLGSAKIPYAVVSVLSMIILFSISFKLWGKRIALYTLFVLAINPWSIYFGRTAFDTPLAVFFAYAYLWCLLYLTDWWLLIAFIPWFIGLYSYQGTIIVYPLILIIGAIGMWKLRKRVFTKQYVTVIGLGIVTFCMFMLAFSHDRTGTRINELATPNNQVIISRVDTDRRKSVQSWMNSVFLNKVTVSSWQIIGQYLGAFSTKNLFISGEDRSTFSLWTHGLFYPMEFFLLLMGIFYAYVKRKNIARFLLVLIFISPIPAAISLVGASYALRASLMYPLFCIFIAIGIESLRIDKKSHWIARFGLVILYSALILNFAHIYFIRNPVNNSEGFGFSNRVLAKYIQLATDENFSVLYIGNNVLNTYRQYLFYNNVLNKNSIGKIQQSIRTREFTVDSAQFIECPGNIPDSIEKYTVITPAGKICPSLISYKEEFNPIVIAQLGDSGRIYEIYNDSVCKNSMLSEYQPMIVFHDLDVEKMSAEKFCRTYISKPKVLP